MALTNDQIAIVHGVNQDYKDLADVTFPNHEEYAIKHGYVIRTSEIKPGEHMWGKIRILRDVLADSNIRKIFWIDADAIFTNMELSLTEHLPDGKFVMSCDQFAPNAGVLWLENCPEVRRFLWAIATRGQQMFAAAAWREQTALRYFAFHSPYRHLMTYVEQRKMNSYRRTDQSKTNGRPADDFSQWNPGDFVLHLPGLENTVRIEAFQKILSR